MTFSTLYSKCPAKETLLYIFVWYSNVLALVQMVVNPKKCHLPVLLCVTCMLLYKHADKCCEQCLPLVLPQVLMWSSLVLFLLTCNSWDSKQKIKVVNKKPCGWSSALTGASFTPQVQCNKDSWIDRVKLASVS